jgi:hypothetical protein
VLVVECAIAARPSAPVDLLDVEIGLLLGDGDEAKIVDLAARLGRGFIGRARRRRRVECVLVEIAVADGIFTGWC